MKIKQFIQRFLIPSAVVTLYYLFKFKAKVSLKAEVECTSNITLGKGSTISSFCKVKATRGKIKIGDNSGFAISAFVGSAGKGITIGENCIFGAHVVIVDSSYGYSRLDIPYKQQPHTSKGITIGNNVYVGSNVTIADGSQIGDNCVIVANSFINRRYPPNCVIQGTPGKIILKR